MQKAQNKHEKFVRVVNSTKWQGMPPQDHVFTLADMDVPLDPGMRKAIMAKLDATNNFTYKNKSKAYLQAIINWYRTRHLKQSHLNIKPQEIHDSPSIINMLYTTIQHFTKEGDGVLVLTPVWYRYEQLVKFLNRKFVGCSLYSSRKQQQFRYDINLTDFESKAQHCKVFILCNPHNPTGRAWAKVQVERMLQICRKYDLLVVSDEILSDFVPDELRYRHYSLVNSIYPKLIVGNSISKAFNVESLKGGYAIIRNKEIGEKFEQLVDQISIRVNEFAALFLEVAYSQEGRIWLKRVRDIIKTNYNYLRDKLKGTMIIMSEYEGPYFVVINFENYVKFIERWFYARKEAIGKQQMMIDKFLKAHQIHGIVQPYFGLYPTIFTEIRFTIGVEQPYMHAFADKLRQVLLSVEFEHKQLGPSL